jgi:hypothetical protein
VSLRLSDVRRDPVAYRALQELSRRYTIAESKTGLVLTQRTGDMKLFIHDLADLHQWDFLWNVRLRELLLAVDEQGGMETSCPGRGEAVGRTRYQCSRSPIQSECK